MTNMYDEKEEIEKMSVPKTLSTIPYKIKINI